MYLRDKNSSPVARPGGEGAAQRVKTIGGEKYQYSHDVEVNITGQDYLGVDKEYYHPTMNGAERLFAEKLAEVRRRRHQASGTGHRAPVRPWTSEASILLPDA
jgi:putative ATPase